MLRQESDGHDSDTMGLRDSCRTRSCFVLLIMGHRDIGADRCRGGFEAVRVEGGNHETLRVHDCIKRQCEDQCLLMTRLAPPAGSGRRCVQLREWRAQSQTWCGPVFEIRGKRAVGNWNRFWNRSAILSGTVRRRCEENFRNFIGRGDRI
jgi:hypothetical protein